MEIPAKAKRSNNSYAVEDKRNVSITHEHKLGVTLSESVIGNYVWRPQRIYGYEVISGLQEIIIISETMHDRCEVTIERK